MTKVVMSDFEREGMYYAGFQTRPHVRLVCNALETLIQANEKPLVDVKHFTDELFTDEEIVAIARYFFDRFFDCKYHPSRIWRACPYFTVGPYTPGHL